eukprot:4515177-Prorocentrum_lima.AAC.1
MTSSLVGSEMCIRDSFVGAVAMSRRQFLVPSHALACGWHSMHGLVTVSYTHLTLPTICSV